MTLKANLNLRKENAKLNEIKNIGKDRKKANKNQDIIKFLIKSLSNKNGLERRMYSEKLASLGKEALPGLINALLNSKDVIQRRAAAKTLKLLEDQTALPYLIKALTNDSDPVVQCSAAGAIAIFGEPAVNHLILILENQEYTEMQYGLATWCLAFIGANAPDAIKKAAKSKNANVKSAAISALEEPIRQLQDKEALQLLESAINDNSDNVQIEAIKLVGKLYKIDSLIPIVISKLKNQNSDIRKASIIALMQLNAKEALNPLKEHLKVESEQNIKKIFDLAIKKIGTQKLDI